MKFKFTWGTGILLTIIIFVSFFISFMIFSFTKDVNLVTKDYFPDEIAYDIKIQKIQNTNALKEKISFNLNNNVLKIEFPSFIDNQKEISGTILFYYIKSARKDIIYPVNINTDNSQFIDMQWLEIGRYTVKADWAYKDKSYFQEETVELK